MANENKMCTLLNLYIKKNKHFSFRRIGKCGHGSSYVQTTCQHLANFLYICNIIKKLQSAVHNHAFQCYGFSSEYDPQAVVKALNLLKYLKKY